jgi:hypothetical protein
MILFLDERKQTLDHLFISIRPGKKTEIDKRHTFKGRIVIFLVFSCLINVWKHEISDRYYSLVIE